MIIEATQTFSPGNIELLIYFLRQLEIRKIPSVVYLGHDYTYNLIDKLKYSHVSIKKSSGFETIIRLLKKREGVLFFCSFPPFVKQKKSLVYFHSPFFAKPKRFLRDGSLSSKIKLIRLLVHFQIRLFKNNVDHFYCQTKSIEQDLKSAFKNIKVEIVPFYNDSDLIKIQHERDTEFGFDFFYPATPDVHKNYFRLFEAVKLLAQKDKIKLCVTIDPKSARYVQKINEINQELNYEAIVNVGRVKKERVLDLYLNSKALIFPSLEESLGLPLIEAAFISCPILGSDLPYIYNVVENPIVFNPYDVEEIADTMKRFLNGEFDYVKQKNKIENKVDQIINYLK